MSHFRSQEMHLYKLCVSKDNAWKQIRQLGATKQIHFIDINEDQPPFKLPYTLQVKRCENIQQKLIELSNQFDKDVGTAQIRPKNMQEFSNCIDVVAQSRKKGLTALFD